MMLVVNRHKGRTLTELFALACAAHLGGERWSDLWPRVSTDVARMADGVAVRRQRIVDRLLAILVSGEMDGVEPPECGEWGEPCGIQAERVGAAR